MPKRTAKFDKDGIASLPNNKPAVYRILDENAESIYVGAAKRNRLRDRLTEHFSGREIPGIEVQIEQMGSIREAKAKEARIISRNRPFYNKKGK